MLAAKTNSTKPDAFSTAELSGSNEEVGRDLAVVKRPDIKETDHEAYSKDPRFADYEAYVRSRVEQILPKDIPDRDKILNTFANGTVDMVYKDPNSMKPVEYSSYILGVYQKVKNSLSGDYEKFGSFTTALAEVQGGMNIPPKYNRPTNQAVFSPNQLEALVSHGNYNESAAAAGYALARITRRGRTPKQVSELSEKILEKYIGKKIVSTSTTADIASITKR